LDNANSVSKSSGCVVSNSSVPQGKLHANDLEVENLIENKFYVTKPRTIPIRSSADPGDCSFSSSGW
jgi:hypothetical protein